MLALLARLGSRDFICLAISTEHISIFFHNAHMTAEAVGAHSFCMEH
jgi:hypothetical protein